MANRNGYIPGDIVSVWYRQSKRHKWRREYSFVQLFYIDVDGFVFHESRSWAQNSTGGYNGLTSCRFRGVGTFERELREPLFLVAPRIGSYGTAALAP